MHGDSRPADETATNAPAIRSREAQSSAGRSARIHRGISALVANGRCFVSRKVRLQEKFRQIVAFGNTDRHAFGARQICRDRRRRESDILRRAYVARYSRMQAERIDRQRALRREYPARDARVHAPACVLLKISIRDFHSNDRSAYTRRRFLAEGSPISCKSLRRIAAEQRERERKRERIHRRAAV